MSPMLHNLASHAARIATLLCLSLTAEAQQHASTIPTNGEENVADGVRRITLPEAQARAATDPALRAAQLSADAAKYHRKAVAADYFPQINSTFSNLHFNKFLGQTISVARRTAEFPLINKNQNLFLVTATQPITPMLKVKQAVNLARADERIAEAKLAGATTNVTSNVESSYFALLIAQLKQREAASELEALRPRIQIALAGDPQSVVPASKWQAAVLEAEREFSTARHKVVQLQKDLNGLLGFPADAELALEMPEPLVVAPMSLAAARQKALGTNLQVIEAEQTVKKADAAVKLSKLEYVPNVAVIAGYSYQTVIPILPSDFSFLGVVATFNVFDFGKRENTIKESKSNSELAQLNLQAVKAKVSKAVQTAFNQFEEATQIREDRRDFVTASYSAAPDAATRQFRAEAEWAQAEWNYRVAYLQLKNVVGDR